MCVTTFTYTLRWQMIGFSATTVVLFDEHGGAMAIPSRQRDYSPFKVVMGFLQWFYLTACDTGCYWSPCASSACLFVDFRITLASRACRRVTRYGTPPGVYVSIKGDSSAQPPVHLLFHLHTSSFLCRRRRIYRKVSGVLPSFVLLRSTDFI